MASAKRSAPTLTTERPLLVFVIVFTVSPQNLNTAQGRVGIAGKNLCPCFAQLPRLYRKPLRITFCAAERNNEGERPALAICLFMRSKNSRAIYRGRVGMRTIAQYDIEQNDAHSGIARLLLETLQTETRVNHGMGAPTCVLIGAKINCAMPLNALSLFYQPPFWLERNI